MWELVTHNFIGRKIISNVKHSDARNSLPILDVKRSSDKRHSASKYCKWTLRQTTGVCYTRIYVLGAPSQFPTEYRHEAAVVSREHRMKWVVVLGDGYPWPLPWECNITNVTMQSWQNGSSQWQEAGCIVVFLLLLNHNILYSVIRQSGLNHITSFYSDLSQCTLYFIT